jgi:hypothetical protein
VLFDLIIDSARYEQLVFFYYEVQIGSENRSAANPNSTVSSLSLVKRVERAAEYSRPSNTETSTSSIDIRSMVLAKGKHGRTLHLPSDKTMQLSDCIVFRFLVNKRKTEIG